ncbi:hypothetical protein ACFWXO_16710 [Kitasatospora sp. NPDC059088]|uniref:hypothetical protein n=1 Tax=Kitasatospora sp. NPDC059088 TaxID=3346722 RepID=UPI00368D2286
MELKEIATSPAYPDAYWAAGDEVFQLVDPLDRKRTLRLRANLNTTTCSCIGGYFWRTLAFWLVHPCLLCFAMMNLGQAIDSFFATGLS